MKNLMNDLVEFVAIRQVQLERHCIARNFGRQMKRFARDDRRRTQPAKHLRDVAEAAYDGRVAKMCVQIFQMEDATNRERHKVTDKHLRICGAVHRTFGADALEAVGDRPGEQRHVQVVGHDSEQVIDPLFFDGVDGDYRMTGLNQRFEVMRRIGVRFPHGSSGCADSMNR